MSPNQIAKRFSKVITLTVFSAAPLLLTLRCQINHLAKTEVHSQANQSWFKPALSHSPSLKKRLVPKSVPKSDGNSKESTLTPSKLPKVRKSKSHKTQSQQHHNSTLASCSQMETHTLQLTQSQTQHFLKFKKETEFPTAVNYSHD